MIRSSTPHLASPEPVARIIAEMLRRSLESAGGRFTILIYGRDSAANFIEWKSTNGGTSFTETTLRAKGVEASNSWPTATLHASLAGKERVIVTWSQTFSGSESYHSNLMLMDRPQE
jgi:hypothetical protein